jgi:hypothetical protein
MENPKNIWGNGDFPQYMTWGMDVN